VNTSKATELNPGDTGNRSRPKTKHDHRTKIGTEARLGETCFDRQRKSQHLSRKLNKAVMGIEPKPGRRLQTGATSFEAQTGKPVTIYFEAKREKIIRVILRPNYSQTVDLGFEAKSRNSRLLSPRARCRLHVASPDLSIARPPSIRHVRLFSVLYTRSPTPTTIIITAHHDTPTTCTARDK
jgi:hypothetical protein